MIKGFTFSDAYHQHLDSMDLIPGLGTIYSGPARICLSAIELIVAAALCCLSLFWQCCESSISLEDHFLAFRLSISHILQGAIALIPLLPNAYSCCYATKPPIKPKFFSLLKELNQLLEQINTDFETQEELLKQYLEKISAQGDHFQKIAEAFRNALGEELYGDHIPEQNSVSHPTDQSSQEYANALLTEYHCLNQTTPSKYITLNTSWQELEQYIDKKTGHHEKVRACFTLLVAHYETTTSQKDARITAAYQKLKQQGITLQETTPH